VFFWVLGRGGGLAGEVWGAMGDGEAGGVWVIGNAI